MFRGMAPPRIWPAGPPAAPTSRLSLSTPPKGAAFPAGGGLPWRLGRVWRFAIALIRLAPERVERLVRAGMGGRGELTDGAWARLRPLPPQNGRRGQQWRDHRQVINVILWRLPVGAPWHDVPTRYGPRQICCDRSVRWRRDGMWDRLPAYVRSTADATGDIVRVVCVDRTSVRARRPGRGAPTTRPGQ